MLDEESSRSVIRTSPSRGRGKRVLAVRVLAAKVAWLDGRLRWQNGRVVWETGEGAVAPGPRELARAERSLRKIRSYPVSAALAFGDAEAWLRERHARLQLAKQLAGIPPECFIPGPSPHLADADVSRCATL